MHLRPAAASLLITVAGTASAQPVDWVIRGTIGQITDGGVLPTPAFQVGDRFVQTLTFDDSVPRTGGGANFSTFSAITARRFEIPSRMYSVDFVLPGNVQTTNNAPNDNVSIAIGNNFFTPSLATLGEGDNQVTADFFRFQFRPPNDTFTMNPPGLAQLDPTWTVTNFEITHSGGIDPFEPLAYELDFTIDVFAPGQSWVNPTGGSFGVGANWSGGVAPMSGSVVIDTPFPVRVEVPNGFVANLDSLDMFANSGGSSLVLTDFSQLTITSPLNIGNAVDLVFDGGTLLLNSPLTTTPGGQVRVVGDNGVILGDVEVSDLSVFDVVGSSGAPASLQVFGTTSVAGAMFVANNASLEFPLGLTLVGPTAFFAARGEHTISAGGFNIQAGVTADFAAAESSLVGPVNNEGAITISGDSDVVAVTGGVTSTGTIVLTPESTLSILGTLTGNGVDGPGGPGTAGPVFVRDGFIPRGGGLGRMGFDGDADLGLNASTTIQIGGTVAGVDADVISVAGTLSVDGVFVVELANGFVPVAGDVYQVLEFGSVSGSFDAVQLDQAFIDANADTSMLLVDGTIRIPGGSCNAADVAPPLGVLDLGDIDAFIAAFTAQDLLADIAPPVGVLDLGDIDTFIAAFFGGCP